MVGKIFAFLFVVMLAVVQPSFAQDGVIILDLGHATDEELTGALDVATDLEMIMRAEWELLEEEEVEMEAEEYPADELALEAEAEGAEPEYLVADAIEAEELEYFAEEPVLAMEVEAEEQEYLAEEPLLAMEVEEEEPEYLAEETPADILDNRYFLESQRLVRLAEEAYEQGDYEAATAYAQEASRYAQLSDDYIAKHTGAEAIAVAATDDDGHYPLPATFTVRPWAIYRDCLWNIAAHPDVYGDPLQWPVLFNANRHRMPNPNNPDLILPGMVLEIPSIDGEVREGNWQSGRVYRRR